MRLLYAVVSLPVRFAREIASRAAALVGDEDRETVAVRVPPEPNYFRAPARPARRARSRGNGGAPAVAPEPEPAHVSEEPELVAEVAEAGAEEGAGAEVHVDEPWLGYSSMRAADIKDRLRAEPAEVAAAVSLYEAAGKGRSSVLEAAARRLR